MTETTAERNRRLYGRRVPRADRRVMLALLTGAPGLSGYPLSRLAQVGYGKVYVILARLERLGWAESEWDPAVPAHTSWRADPRRRFYRLTAEGRAGVTELLGLEEDEDHG